VTKSTAVDRRPGHRSASEGRRAPSSVGEGELAAPAESSQLFGRERELTLLSGLLEDVGAQGGSLLLRGEAGIGKSALLGEARRRADQLGMRVLSTSGAPFEAQMPFAGLQRLLRPVMDEIGALPPPQRGALSVALGLSGGPAPDVFLTALAALNLVTDRAAEAPLLLVVEDAHWLDAASVDVLAFVARRVEMEPIVLLLAARDGPTTYPGETGCENLLWKPWTTTARTPCLRRAPRSLQPSFDGACSTKPAATRWRWSSFHGPSTRRTSVGYRPHGPVADH
jgi:hypothetical protein